MPTLTPRFHFLQSLLQGIRRPKISRALKIGFSMACLILIWHWISLEQLKKSFSGLSWIPFGLAVVLNLLHKILNAVKIRHLFPPPPPALEDLVRINFIAVFFRTILPGVVGGELVRWAYFGQVAPKGQASKLGQAGPIPISKSRAMAVILLDRITGLWAQIFLSLAAWLWLSRNSLTLWIAGPIALGVFFISLWAGLWGYRSLTLGLVRLGRWYMHKQPDAAFTGENIQEALVQFMATREQFWKVVFFSLASHALVIATFLLLDRSIQGQLELAPAMLLLFCYSLILLLPVAFGNWGLSEGTLGLLYHYTGAGGAFGIALSLTLRLMDLPAVILGWIFFLLHRHRQCLR